MTTTENYIADSLRYVVQTRELMRNITAEDYYDVEEYDMAQDQLHWTWEDIWEAVGRVSL